MFIKKTVRLGLAIRVLRKALKLTQSQFADRIKIAPTTETRYERGSQRPSEPMLRIFLALAQQEGLEQLIATFRDAIRQHAEEKDRVRAQKQKELLGRIKRLGGTSSDEFSTVSTSSKIGEDRYNTPDLWNSARTLLDQAKSQRIGDHKLSLRPVILLTYAALESYLNFVEGRVILALSGQRKDRLFKYHHSGVLDKLRRLSEVFQGPYPGNDDKRYSSLVELVSLRNQLAHLGPDDGVASPASIRSFDDVDTQELERLFLDSQVFIEDLHRSFRQSKDPLVSLPEFALTAGLSEKPEDS
jgi:transcriptional regulator with XRE-family HTH domain